MTRGIETIFFLFAFNSSNELIIFDIQFSGTWYEIERFDNPHQRGDCVNTNYIQTGGNSFRVEATERRNGQVYAFVDHANFHFFFFYGHIKNFSLVSYVQLCRSICGK